MKPHHPRSKQPPHKRRSKSSETNERIQKALAHAGFGSRREIEQWIREGLVRVNGKPAKLGDRVGANDLVRVKGREVNFSTRPTIPTRVLLYHKPTGELVTRRDPQGRAVIFTQLPKLKTGRWVTIGRLDINSQGLLLVTTNGELANTLMHPSREVEREYAVRVFGRVSEKILANLRGGVELDDGVASFDSIEPSGGEGINTWFRVVLKQGRNRVVRRLFESQGLSVSRLIRIRYGPIVLPEKLKARTFYELDKKELAALLEFAGIQTDEKQPKRRSKNNRLNEV